MKLSFVIPAHNEEKYIGQCLESIFKQFKRKNYSFEIIVVNNASNDKTGEVAASFPGVIVVDEPRLGLPRARQSGFEASTGELIANVDADTILPEGWIDKVLQKFSNNPNLVALSGPHVYYDLSQTVNTLVNFYYHVGYLTHLINHYILRISAMMQGGNFVLKRSALEKIGGFSKDILFYGEDTDIARRIQKVGRVEFTFKLPMQISGRRLKAEGILIMVIKYPLNYFWVTFFKKPFNKNFKSFR